MVIDFVLFLGPEDSNELLLTIVSVLGGNLLNKNAICFVLIAAGLTARVKFGLTGVLNDPKD